MIQYYRSSSRLSWSLALALTAAVCSSQADVSTSSLPVMTGTQVIDLESKVVGDSFKLYIRPPEVADAKPDATYPVIFTLDGDHTFPQMASIMTQISWAGHVPPAVIVGIGYGTLDLENGNHRSRDLSPQPFPGRPESGGGDQFLSFLLEEVIPFLESKYPIDSEERYLFGHSLGGLFALYAYVEAPETFAGIIAGSPFLKGQLPLLDSIAKQAENAGARSCRLFVSTGGQEDAGFFLNDLPALTDHLESDWAATGSFEVTQLPDFDHFTMVAPSMANGLRFVFLRPIVD